MSNDLQKEIAEMLQKIEDILPYALEGLLKSDVLYQTKNSIEDRLKELSPKFDTRTQLQIEKSIPVWRNLHKSGLFMNPRKALDEVTPLHTLLNELNEKIQNNQKDENIKSEVVIVEGQPHEGRKYLRFLLDEAQENLFIRDSYFKPQILDLLTEFLIDKQNLHIRIITGDNRRLAALRSYYQTFNQEYPGRIEIKYRIGKEDHPRYIITDGTLVFNPDHSLDQWGDKTVNINQMSDIEEIEKITQKMEAEWSESTNI